MSYKARRRKNMEEEDREDRIRSFISLIASPCSIRTVKVVCAQKSPLG